MGVVLGLDGKMIEQSVHFVCPRCKSTGFKLYGKKYKDYGWQLEAAVCTECRTEYDINSETAE